MNDPSHIYWANAMFSAADRAFNAQCAGVLRHAGYHVFLPQEAAVNTSVEESLPASEDIFRVDTSAILGSSCLVACIDQETIDSGVACEIGIARAHGIPIVGLYTDMRQHRTGQGHMYKNLYVLGAIGTAGEIVSRVDDLPRTLEQYLESPESSPLPSEIKESARQHFNSIALRYSAFVQRLESWYSPPWGLQQILDPWFQADLPGRVVEYGCGAGRLGKHISRRFPSVYYLGYDISRAMIEVANVGTGTNSLFTSAWAEVENQAGQRAFDMAVVAFTLHDHPAPGQTLSHVADCIRPGGTILIVDLSAWDLPALTDLLRRGLALPLRASDSRLDPVKLTALARAARSAVTSCEVAMPLVHFPSAADLGEYLDLFGVFDGMDLPLGLKRNAPLGRRRSAKRILENQTYPFTDQRAFVVCILEKQ